MRRPSYFLGGKSHSWIESPSSIPIGLLIEQIPTHFEIPNLLALRMCFKSGDFVEFHTIESASEAVVIDLGVQAGAHLIEV